jgi:hypothetical protein
MRGAHSAESRARPGLSTVGIPRLCLRKVAARCVSQTGSLADSASTAPCTLGEQRRERLEWGVRFHSPCFSQFESVRTTLNDGRKANHVRITLDRNISENGNLVTFMMYPGEFHYFAREHVLRDAWHRVDDFFALHQRGELSRGR